MSATATAALELHLQPLAWPPAPAEVELLRVAGDAGLRQAFLAGLPGWLDSVQTRRSHLLEGRYENLYPGLGQVPMLAPLFELVRAHVALRLRTTPRRLRLGFWVNLSQPGQRTLAHCHDDLDEQVSGCYYVATPADCGDFLLHCKPRDPWRYRPQAGTLLLFPPARIHEVERHRGQGPRISVAFNIGPAAEQE